MRDDKSQFASVPFVFFIAIVTTGAMVFAMVGFDITVTKKIAALEHRIAELEGKK